MASNETIDERLRAVEQNATKTAKEPVSPNSRNFADANRNAEEMIQWIKEKHEKAGVQPDALAATVKSGEAAYRLEVTMDTKAAKALFGAPNAGIQALQRRVDLSANNITRSIWNSYLSFAHTPVNLPRDIQQLAALRRRATLPEWMESVLKLDEDEQTAPALDTMFSRIDSMLSAAEFDKVDEVIAAIPVEGPSLSLMLGLLSITRPAAERLPSRERFFSRVYRLCKAMRRDAEALLGGLK